MNERKVLLLNQGYEPIATVTWQHAICLYFRGRGHIIEEYPDWQVRSATAAFKVPAVLRLDRYTRSATRNVKFCRENVYIRDDSRCQYCGKYFAMKHLTLDHVIPRSKGGRTSWENIVAACTKCNNAKADRSLHEAGMKLLNEPVVPNSRELRHRYITNGAPIPAQWQQWLQ